MIRSSGCVVCKNTPLNHVSFACILSLSLSLAPLPLPFNPSASCRSVRLPVSVPIRFHLIHVTSINMQSSSDKSRPLSLPPLYCRHCSSRIILFSSPECFAVKPWDCTQHAGFKHGFGNDFLPLENSPTRAFQYAFLSSFLFLYISETQFGTCAKKEQKRKKVHIYIYSCIRNGYSGRIEIFEKCSKVK